MFTLESTDAKVAEVDIDFSPAKRQYVAQLWLREDFTGKPKLRTADSLSALLTQLAGIVQIPEALYAELSAWFEKVTAPVTCGAPLENGLLCGAIDTQNERLAQCTRCHAAQERRDMNFIHEDLSVVDSDVEETVVPAGYRFALRRSGRSHALREGLRVSRPAA